MSTDRFLRFRGAVRALRAVGSTLLIGTTHDEGHAMALWRVDLEKNTLDPAPLPGGATDLLLVDELVYLAGTDGHVHRSRALTGPAGAIGEAAEPAPTHLAALKGGRVAALGGQRLRVLDGKTGKLLQEFELPEPGTAMGADPGGSFLVVGGSRGLVTVFDGEGRDALLAGESSKLHEGEVTLVQFGAEELRFFSTGVDRRLLTTHVRGKLEPEDRGAGGMHDGPVRALCEGPESQGADRRFYTAGDDGVIKAWPSGANRRRPTTARDGTTRGVALCFVDFKDRPHLALGMDGGVRLFAVDAGGKVGAPVLTLRGALDHARKELSAAEPARRQAALRALAGDKDQASIDLIAAQVGADADHALRLEATQLLGDSGHRRAHGHLLGLLKSRHSAIRLAALAGLRTLDGPTALGPLESALSTRNADVGVAAVEALASLAKDDDRAWARLVGALSEDPAEVRNEALARLEALLPSDSPEASLEGLRSSKADLRRRALIRLFQRGLLELPAVQVALRRHAEDADADVRLVAFQVVVLSRPSLADALRHLDRDLHRQLHELETWGQEAPPKPPRTKAVQASSLSDADLRPLLGAMASRALDTCLRGAGGLADLGDPRAFGALLQLSREADAGARVAACKALSALGEPRALGRLRMMIRDGDSAVRDAAFSALSRLQEKSPLDAAEAGLIAEHEDVRRRGLQLLVKELREKKATERGLELLSRALNDAGAAVRSEAFKAALNLEVKGGGADTLRFALQSLHVDVRREVLNELSAQLGEPWAWALLLELQADPDPRLRREAFDLALKKGKGRALEPLAAAMGGRHPDLRVEATRQLATKRQADARELLIAALDDVEREVRDLALSALVTAEDDEAVRGAMSAGFADVRVRAACARAALGDPAALQPLLDLVNEPEPEEASAKSAWNLRVAEALGGLGGLGDLAALDAVAAHLQSKNPDVRRGAVGALAWVSRPERTEALREALRHDDEAVRKSAALGLAYNGDPAGVSLLAAPAPSGGRRRRGSVALDFEPFIASLGLGKSARDALLGWLDHDDWRARGPALAAVLLLERSGGGAAPSLLLAALSSGQAESRLIGASGLQEFPKADDYEAFVVQQLNERVDGLPWTVSVETWRGLAALLTSSDPQHRARAGQVLITLGEATQEPFDRAWRALGVRLSGALPSLLAAAEERAAGRSRGDAHEINELVFGAYVGLTRTQGGREMTRLRQRAVLRLLEMAGEDEALKGATAPVLIQALGDDQALVRVQAFEGLRQLGVEAGALGAEALAVGHADIGVLGLKLLAEAAGGAAGDAVLRDIMLSRDDGMEGSAAELLVERGARPEVSVAALEARSEALRLRALQWLNADYAELPAAAAGLRGATSSRFKALRTYAALYLGHHQDPAGFEPLLQVLASSERRAQRDAIAALTRLGDPRTAGALLDRVDDDPGGSAEVDRLIAAAGALRDASVTERLFVYLDDRARRGAAFDALLTLSGYDQPIDDPNDERLHDRAWLEAQHPRSEALLARLVQASYALNETRRLANILDAARWSPGNTLDAALGPVINSSTSWVRDSALAAIAWRLRHRGGPPGPLLAALESKDAAVRFLAAEGLALAGRKDGLAVLLASVELMPELDYRRRAVVALGELADTSALQLLIKLAEEEGHALQEQAAEALGRIAVGPQAEAVFKLLARLAEGEGGVAMQALSGLRWLGSADAWALIRRRATDGGWQVQERCAELLEHEDSAEGLALLERLVREDDDWDVIDAAYSSLRSRSGADSLKPALALLLSAYPRLDEAALTAVAERAPAEQVFALLPKVPERHHAEVFQPLVEALLARDPLPVAEAAGALADGERDALVAVAARVLGRAGPKAGDAHVAALSENTTRVLELWVQAREAAARGDGGALPARAGSLGVALERLIWACGRTGAGAEAAVRAARLSGSEAPVARLRRAALLVLAEGVGGEDALLTLAEAVSGSDPLARAIAASGLAARDPERAAGQAAAAMGDPATLARLLSGASSGVDALRAGALNAHQAGVALPGLVARADVEGLSAIAADRGAPEASRMGAVEGLGRLSLEAVEAPLLAVATAEDEDKEMRKAAWRSLRRSRRARAQQEVSR